MPLPCATGAWASGARAMPAGLLRPRVRVAAAALALGALLGAAAAAAETGLPNPCQAVPGAEIASALRLKHAPASALATVPKLSTCSFAGGKLTVSVGFTTLPNPRVPAKVVRVHGLPGGTYRTYAGSTQTEILFVKGPAATGVYGVVRNFVRISRQKLEAIAKALYAAIPQVAPTQPAPSVKLVSG